MAKQDQDRINVRLSEVSARLKEVSTRTAAERRETQDRLAEGVADIAADQQKQSREERRSELARNGSDRTADEVLKIARLESGGRKAIDVIMDEPNPKDEQIAEAQKTIDQAYILSAVMGRPVTSTKFWRERVERNPLLKKAIDLASIGGGFESTDVTKWQPAEFSNRMIEKIRLETVVAQLHDSFQMPQDPFRFTAEGPDAQVHLIPEVAGIDAELTGSNRIKEALASPGASNIIFSTRKLGGRVATSNETLEDSYVAMLSYLENKLVLAHAYMKDNVVVNGDSAGALDSGVTYGTTNQLLAWDGYRKFVNAKASKIAAAGGVITIEKMREVRQNMGIHGMKPQDLVLLTGPVGYIKLLDLKDSTGRSLAVPHDTFGDGNTLRTGELATIDGIPVIVSAFIGGGVGAIPAESLNTSGLYDGVTTSTTELLWVRPSLWTFATRRGLTMNVRDLPHVDQKEIMTLERLTFRTWYPSEISIGALYNVTK